MLASPRGVDRSIERYIRRIIVGNHRFAAIDDQFGSQRRQFGIQTTPAVILGATALLFKTPGGIADAATAFLDQGFGHGKVIKNN